MNDVKRDPAVDAVARADGFERARSETVRDHEELYASAAVGQAGSWLADTQPLMVDALARLSPGKAVTAYDLGAGIGRHTLPMLGLLPAGSEVYAVDLLESELDRISGADSPENGVILHTVQEDLVDFTFRTPADLVIFFSAIEPLPDEERLRSLLERIEVAMNPAGVAAAGIVADRFEVGDDGKRRPALLGSGLSASRAHELLTEVFDGFVIDYVRSNPAEVDEERDGEHYTLNSTLVTFLARRPTAITAPHSSPPV